MAALMLNKAYTDANVWHLIREDFRKGKPKHAVLKAFFDKNRYDALRTELKRCARNNVKIADRYSYSIIESRKIKELFNSSEFLEFISFIAEKKITHLEIIIREFGWKDYTLLHDKTSADSGLKVFFFVPSIDEWDYFWGGSIVYKTSEGKSLVFVPSENTLCIVDKRKEDEEFTQYVNHYVGSERVIMIEAREG
ncbi:hypothetical protein HYZ97_01695 [Candidatus Pacearchaeota archaeon]|nr:hypothetical protein [Candidatus Pacearchaeota archaeon]